MKRLILSVCIAGLIVPAVFAESQSDPNDPNDQLKFERSKEYAGWIIEDQRSPQDDRQYYEDPGPVKPPYVAQVMLHRDRPNHTSPDGVLKRIQDSPISKKLSKDQQEFLKAGFAVWTDDESKNILNHFSTWLYAVTEDDARIMAEAYLDGLQGLVDEQIDVYQSRLAEYQQNLTQAQEVLPDKEKQLEASYNEYDKARESLHKFDSDAMEAARATISEMDKMLDAMEIEFVGIREKLKTIEKFRKRDSAEPLATQVYYKLDEIYVELMIERSGVEARISVAQDIRARERSFVDVYRKWITVRDEVGRLTDTIGRSQRGIEDVTDRLANPSGNMLSPKVYQNKVRIHRIKGSTAPEDVEKYLEETFVADPLMYRGASLANRLNLAANFLGLVGEGSLRLEPAVVERLRTIERKLQEAKVEQLLSPVERANWNAVDKGQLNAFASRYFRDFRDAKEYLEAIEGGKMHATLGQVDRLKDFIKAYERLQERLQEQE